MSGGAYKHTCIFVVIELILLFPEALADTRIELCYQLNILFRSHLDILLTRVGRVTNNDIYIYSIITALLDKIIQFRAIALLPGRDCRCDNYPFRRHSNMRFVPKECVIGTLVTNSCLSIFGCVVMIFNVINGLGQQVHLLFHCGDFTDERI